MNVICMHKWMLFSHKWDWNPVLCDDMDRIKENMKKIEKTDMTSLSNRVNHLN